MLYAIGAEGRREVAAGPHAVAANQTALGAVWLDLVNGTEAERSLVERATGLRVPAREELAEIESSSRLSAEGEVLYLSTPTHVVDEVGHVDNLPLGFVLSERVLLTVRYAALSTFDHYAARKLASTSIEVFVGLLEAIVDRLADELERLGGELDEMSRLVFRGKKMKGGAQDRQLQAVLRRVGRAGERLSNLRDSLLGVQRAGSFTAETAGWVGGTRSRFATLRQDIASLADYDSQLSGKVQFLLDATLGFINIEQNNGIKVLTVVSVVGVPPTLVASIYGMNFKNMPELGWTYGYAYGLGVIVLSAVVPLVWFWRKGWI